MSEVRNVPCADPVRLRIYEELSSDFLRLDPMEPGTCKTCGATGIMVDSSDRCIAQASLAQHRRGPKVKDDFRYGAELDMSKAKGGQAIVAEFSVLLVEPGHAYTNARVIPSRPLPASTSHMIGSKLGAFLDKVVRDPVVPYVLASFSRKADMRMVETTNPDRIVLNGTEPPTVLDRRMLLRLLDLFDEFGAEAVRKASAMRALVHSDRATAKRHHAWLEANAPGLLARVKTVPHPTIPEFEPAMEIHRFRNPKPGAAGADQQADVQDVAEEN